ncbi:MAG: leucine-rich repeat domain-containing protein [Clostridia bacterium]|nr:leucine-rich repeat domain-containing protein [Clostridia bacterium]
MKKRLAILAVVVMALMCLLAISVNAEEVLNNGNPLITSTSDEFATGDNINYITGLANEIYFNGTSSQGNKALSLEQRMVLKNDDGTYSTFPSAYLFNISKDGNKRAHRFQWLDVTLINAATGQNYESADLIRLEIPEGIVDIHHDDRSANARLGMQNSTDLKAENLKYISFPASCTGTLTMADFARGITALEEVDFSKMTNPYSFSMGTAFYGCTSLSKVTFPETFNSDNGSIGTCQINENMFYECPITSISLPKEITTINKYAFKKSGLVSIDLSGCTALTSILQDAFRECKSLKTIKMPLKLNNIGAEAFRDCTALEFVDFGENTAATFQFPAHRAFYNCGNLRAISLPENTTHINNGTFALCKKLEAIYLGNAIIQINGNKGDSAGDGPTFAECEKMYFVNEPFSVTKDDGSFYTVEEWKNPAKPDVYYFPSTLKRICGAHNINSSFTMTEDGHVQNVGGADLAFVKCYNLNKYLVFPEGFTGVDEGTLNGNNEATENENQRGDTLDSGLFHNCATESNPLTLVFLGRIDRISFDRRNGQTSYMTYMFANPANTSFENTKIGTYFGNAYYSNQNEMYVIFCNTANSEGEGGILEGNHVSAKYKINFVASESDANVPVLKATAVDKVDSNEDTIADEWHVIDVRNDDQMTPATCIANAKGLTFCFCGASMGEMEVPNTATGKHECVDDGNCTTASEKCTADPNCTYFIEAKEHALVHTLVYANGVGNAGLFNHYCKNDGCYLVADTDDDGEIDGEIIDKPMDPIITARGYSIPVAKVDYVGINAGYAINKTLFDLYKTLNAGVEFEIKLFMVNSKIDDELIAKVLNGETLTLATGVKGFMLKVESLDYSSINIEIRGFNNATEEGSYYKLELISAMVVRQTKEGQTLRTDYIQSNLIDGSAKTETIDGVTYNIITAKAVYDSLSTVE